ncbi:MAG: hypothetical protein IPG22_06085 [Acidobacteria bacterium]|nr:hypothetical protein [Acidobacteriota bacterium]
MDQLLKDGKVRRKLGIRLQTITDEAAEALELKDKSGVLVSEVDKGSAAEKSGR